MLKILETLSAQAGTLGMFIIALVSLLFVLHSKRAKRKMLVNAVYHHVMMAIPTLENLCGEKGGGFWKAHRDNIKKDPAYAPFFVQSRADDLTYDLIIESLEVLKGPAFGISEEDERKMMEYFHHDKLMHAVADSFSSALHLSTRRKLDLLESFISACNETLNAAKHLEPVLAARRK